MKLVMVSVYDRAAHAYGRPVACVSEGVALRSFHGEVNRVHQDNDMNKHPADFDLYVLGSFDDSDGSFVCEAPKPRLLTNGGALAEKGERLPGM